MEWQVAVLAGVGGGLAISMVNLVSTFGQYIRARQRARMMRRRLPHWKSYFDPIPDILAVAVRLIVGALLGFLFRGQFTSVAGAVFGIGGGVIGSFALLQSLAPLVDSRRADIKVRVSSAEGHSTEFRAMNVLDAEAIVDALVQQLKDSRAEGAPEESQQDRSRSEDGL
ncbi:hypothetical protein AB0L82_35485 [Nocardia sp. NPDC052001]|uniref:hypothetical protein n=1 Tax=Nocardia sp. NPDC052001 TaxID=3154853 RepID=UPI0034219C3B